MQIPITVINTYKKYNIIYPICTVTDILLNGI